MAREHNVGENMQNPEFKSSTDKSVIKKMKFFKMNYISS